MKWYRASEDLRHRPIDSICSWLPISACDDTPGVPDNVPHQSERRTPSLRRSFCAQHLPRDSDRPLPVKGKNGWRFGQLAGYTFERIVAARDEVRAYHQREVVQRAKQAATFSSAERDLRHLQPLLLDGRCRNTNRGQHLACCAGKSRSKPGRLAYGNEDRKARSFADKQKPVTVAHSNQISVPVAEPRRGPDGGR